MLSEELPGQIELLVDHLRKSKDNHISLTDVASVTEVLIGTMSAYFSSIDTSIYKECQSLTDYIANARTEIASMQPTGDVEEETGTTRAGMELDAIVQATEEATNTIMTAAEEIMSADPSSKEDQAKVQDAVMQIFEACSFQDITGQRISKVVETLTHIESRVAELSALLGVSEEDILRAQSIVPDKEGDEALLSGPALEGEGIDQTAVDDLMGVKKQAGPSSLIDNQEDIDALKDSSDIEISDDAEPAAEAEAASEVGVSPEAEPEAEEDKDETNETTSQDDIDALFN